VLALWRNAKLLKTKAERKRPMDTPLIKRAYNLGLKAVPNFAEALGEEQIAYYENHLGELREAIRRGFVLPVAEPVAQTDLPAEVLTQVGKFALLVDLGIITVPDDYDHATCLAKFFERHQGGKKKSFYYYNNDITDAHFPNPTRILKSGDKLHVRAFKQVVGGTTTSEERMAFLATQKAIHTGAQGASLIFDQKRDQLPKGKWYASFDGKDRLWADVDGDHRVPFVDAYSDGGFVFDLGLLEDVWSDYSAFFCFCDVE